MRLLVLTTSLFGAPAGGGEICSARLLQGLRDAGHSVTLLGHGDAAAALRWCDQAQSLGPLEPPFSAQPLARRLLAVAAALARGTAITVHRQGDRTARPAVAARLAQGFDACIVDHLQAWPWLGACPPLPVMLVNHNVESDNYQRLARAANRGCRGNTRTRYVERALMRREAERLRRTELQALQSAAVVACLSQADAARMAALAQAAGLRQTARLLVLPGYPMAEVVMAAPAAGSMAGGLRRVGLIGNWTWAPNRAGLLWLLQAVWPRLQGRCRLVLAGVGLEGLALPPGTAVLGRVGDVSEFYAAVDLIAIASLHGSGVQEKAIEAIGSGLAVVATSHALRGLEPGLPVHVHRADEAAGFARLCLEAPLQGADRAAGTRWAEVRRNAHATALTQALRLLAGERTVESGALSRPASTATAAGAARA